MEVNNLLFCLHSNSKGVLIMQDVEDGAVIERLSEALEGSKFICTYPVVCTELSYLRLLCTYSYLCTLCT